MNCFKFEMSFLLKSQPAVKCYVLDRVQNILFFNSYSILFFYTFSTMCILEDRSLWILDWGAIASNVV